LITSGSAAIVLVVFLVGGGGVMVAYNLLWRRSFALFCLAIAVVAAGLVWLVTTGAYMNIARFLWPMAFDEVRGPEMKLRISCEGVRPPSTVLILAPIMLALCPWLLKEKRYWPTALAGVGVTLLFGLIYVSPLPDHLAPLIFPEDQLRLPGHCGQKS